MRAKEFTEGYYNQKPGSTVGDHDMPKSLGPGPSHSMSDNDRDDFDSRLKTFLKLPGGYDPEDSLDPRNISPGKIGKIKEVILSPSDQPDPADIAVGRFGQDLDNQLKNNPPTPPKPGLGMPEIDDMHKQAYAVRKGR